MERFVAAAIEACREIRALTHSRDDALYSSHAVGHGGDVSSGMDLKAEEICFRHLSPYGSFFSEESGWMSPESSVNIICDPIDGSDNFASSFPYYGVSIARERDGATTEALVCNLSNGDIFIRTQEAYYRSSLDNPALELPVIASIRPKIGLFEKAPEHPELVRLLMAKKLKFRSPGALALSLAYAPYVKYVLFLGTMRPYDIQAGLYLSRHLHVHQDERYILISTDETLFEQIRSIVEKEYY